MLSVTNWLFMLGVVKVNVVMLNFVAPFNSWTNKILYNIISLAVLFCNKSN